jgi:hypothetical protein
VSLHDSHKATVDARVDETQAPASAMPGRGAAFLGSDADNFVYFFANPISPPPASQEPKTTSLINYSI